MHFKDEMIIFIFFRIFCKYKTFTKTGRIIMQDPNLQNTSRNFNVTLESFDLAKDLSRFSCRSIFVPDEGFCFVSADYCQLEFRILAHLCQDVTLQKIINSGRDIFKSIISEWYKISFDEVSFDDTRFATSSFLNRRLQVDEELRYRAKMMCYGIIYGMGSKSLSLHLNMTENEADDLMKTFYSTYPAIERYRKTTMDQCHIDGYVETLYGRRRVLPTINCSTIVERRKFVFD
jgi:DNA polymerase theta